MEFHEAWDQMRFGVFFWWGLVSFIRALPQQQLDVLVSSASAGYRKCFNNQLNRITS
jgi:hypothetical protein